MILRHLKLSLITATMGISGMLFAEAPEDQKPEKRSIPLKQVVETYAKRYKKIVVPDDNIMNQVANRNAVILVPSELKEVEKDPELWSRVLENILLLHNYTFVEQSDVVRLVPLPNTKKMKLPVLEKVEKVDAQSNRVVMLQYRLKHVHINVVRPYLNRFNTNELQALPLPDNHTIVLTGVESTVKKFLDLVEMLDRPRIKFEYREYQLKHADAKFVMKSLQNYFNQDLAMSRMMNAANQRVKPVMLHDSRTNRFLVKASEENHKKVQRVIDFLDVQNTSHAVKASLETRRDKARKS